MPTPDLNDRDLARLQSHLDANGTAAGFKPTAKKKRQNLEWRLQFETFQWWRSEPRPIPHHLFFHIPNGSVLAGNKEQREMKGRMLKLTGMENGVCDCFLSTPRGPWHGAYIEFKSPAGVLSEEQECFITDVQIQGYFTAVCRTLEDTQKVIMEYLK